MNRHFIYGLLRTLSQLALLLFFDFRSDGSGNVPSRGGLILACTHESHLDPIVIATGVRRRIGFVARKSLFKNAFFGWLIGELGARPFDRDETGVSELKGVFKLLSEGEALVFFPEGTRSKDGELGPLKPGIALLARRAGVPVVPVAVDGTFECWPRHQKMFRPGRIRVKYGKPIQYGSGHKKTEVLADLSEKLAKLKSEAGNLA